MSPSSPPELEHYDPAQLYFQVGEIFVDRIYLRHGIELSAGATVFDVGANVGVASLFFAECGATSVHAFEPVPAIHRILERNLRRAEACTAHSYGLGGERGTVSFTFYPGAAAMSSRYADRERDQDAVRSFMEASGIEPAEVERQVESLGDSEVVECELRTLSDAVRDLGVERIDLLKVDVERAEREVLAGIDDADWRRVRQLVAEVHDDGGLAEDLLTDLGERGFEVVVEQEPAWRDSGVKMIYAVRRDG